MVLLAEVVEEEESEEAGWVDSAALALRTKRCVLGGMGLKKVMMMGGLDRVRLGVGLGIGGEKERRLQRVKRWLWEQRTASPPPPPPPLAKADIAFIFVYNCVSDSQRETVFLFFKKKRMDTVFEDLVKSVCASLNRQISGDVSSYFLHHFNILNPY